MIKLSTVCLFYILQFMVKCVTCLVPAAVTSFWLSVIPLTVLQLKSNESDMKLKKYKQGSFVKIVFVKPSWHFHFLDFRPLRHVAGDVVMTQTR